MANPSVCCVMLVNGRPAMVKRAIESFRSQTYENKHLLIYDTTPGETNFLDEYHEDEQITIRESQALDHHGSPKTIGYLRNRANHNADCAEIIAHFDSDDHSHPRRLEEQVALLQSAKKCCVGYKDMLFWETCGHCHAGYDNTLPYCPYCGLKYDPSRQVPVGKAWLWTAPGTGKPIGTSLCYWRAAWQARPFGDHPKKKGATGEEHSFLQGLDYLGVSSISRIAENGYVEYQPRMIASIHGSNTQYYNPTEAAEQSDGTSWRRAAEWDNFCQETMKL